MPGLRELAEKDLAFIMEDPVGGFGWPITLTDPQNVTYPEFTGFSTDIALAIDPQTGTIISGRTASIALRISSLMLAGIESYPRAMPKKTDKPWVVRFNDINGKPCVFAVADSRPDRALGVIVLILEDYKI